MPETCPQSVAQTPDNSCMYIMYIHLLGLQSRLGDNLHENSSGLFPKRDYCSPGRVDALNPMVGYFSHF